MNAMIPRETIETICGYRVAALKLFEEAYDKLEAANDAVKAAGKMWERASPGVNSYNASYTDEGKEFSKAIALPDRARYLRTARKLIDVDVWAWVVEKTDLERLMDTQAKKELRDQMAYVPDRVTKEGQLINEDEIAKGLPEPNVENIYATLEKFMGEADMIFRRGLANTFSKLDRRFRSHDGFKIGSRIILDRAFDEYGGINYNSGHRDRLIDIERVFTVLDGDSIFGSSPIIHAIDRNRRFGNSAHQSEIESPWVKIRIFKNGNAHLWFKRGDLVKKANKLLAEYYGEVIGDGGHKEDDPFKSVKTAPARFYGFYPTPDAAVKIVMEHVNKQLYPIDGIRLRVLEPSAGTGNLAHPLTNERSTYKMVDGERVDISVRHLVDCVEVQPHLAQALADEDIYNRVFNNDFLALNPEMTGLYDVIVMNPPFDRERDIDHVMHASTFLKPDGYLIAIMSAGTEFRETRKAVAFRSMVEKLKGRMDDLPAGSFSEVGTNVNTLYVRFHKDGKAISRW
jgi:Domain of unknown function (DUF4942)/Methyltransferase small domain